MRTDPRRMDALFRRFANDLGAALSAPLVVLGERLGLYRALAEAGHAGIDAADLARRTGTSEPLVSEWLVNQAAGGYVEFDPASGLFRLGPEYAEALAGAGTVAALRDAFAAALACWRDLDGIERAFRAGAPTAPGAAGPAPALRFPPVLRVEPLAALTTQWIPALAGVDTGLRAGGRAAEVGCADGAVTAELAAAYPRAAVLGLDPDPAAIERCAARPGLPGNAQFRVGSFADLGRPAGEPGAERRGPFDFVLTVDSFHAQPEPVAAAGAVRRCLKPGGAWMVVEPAAGPRPGDAIGPCGRLMAAAAAAACLADWSAAGAANGGPLGGRAGEARLRRAIIAAGFGRVRRAAETPWHIVLEARP